MALETSYDFSQMLAKSGDITPQVYQVGNIECLDVCVEG